jgi:hypothetical protein
LQLLVLANSKKFNGRCIAGIDLDSGKWLRPVSNTEHGEFTAAECSVNVGSSRRQVQPLDVIEITVGASKPGIGHPEDVHTNHGNWKYLVSIPAKEGSSILDNYLDNGHELLFNREASVPETDAKSGKVKKSLCVIRVNDAIFDCSFKNQLRVKFTHRGRKYNLPVTDEGGWVAVAKRNPASTSKGPWYFTISLGEPYKEKMWKLIAGGVLASSV